MDVKTVGIILREFKSEFRRLPLYGFKDDLISFLRKYEINVICIPVKFDNKNEIDRIKNIIEFCDGIIFPGGSGINDVDCDIMRYLHEIDKPTLGICLGMQIMGKSFEGEVVSGGAEEIHDAPSKKYVHEVKIDKNSNLYKIIGSSEIRVNSRHSDCVKYTSLDSVAKSENGQIEAIEDKNKKFFMGVQWHPESIIDDENSNRLFDYFVAKL